MPPSITATDYGPYIDNTKRMSYPVSASAPAPDVPRRKEVVRSPGIGWILVAKWFRKWWRKG
ncbi:Protein of unknown function [Pyronema omphalodes CBS 100304]|uniref:Uncharacterized protein n=1 Tax=Pyronema omphalodes (strain CBS 100304) TaxID=1076935 RepID=U4KWS3_PYROM|nr:Protein of unknown function [Pyronema omphalodes CBS 100304]